MKDQYSDAKDLAALQGGLANEGVSCARDEELARGIAREVAAVGGRVYYVGGFVRDQLLGKPNKDVDIEVHGVPVEQLEEILAKFGTVDAFGASFGIFSLKGFSLDIAVPRKEEATGGGGHKDFRVMADPFLGLHKAAMRRDLTMNTLFQDVLTGEIVDYFGGVQDLERGVIRHASADTFVEDPLRVFRVAQFAARFEMDVDPATTELCSQVDLTKLPSERVLEEMKKALMKSSRPSVFFEELRKMDQLGHWFPEALALVGVPQNPKYHPEGDVWVHTMMVLDCAASMRDQAQFPLGLMLAALCHDFGKPQTTKELDGRIVSHRHEIEGVPVAAAFLDRVVGSPRVKAYVANMVRFHMSPNAYVKQGARQKAYNKLFDRSCCPRDLLLLAKADKLGRGTDVGYEDSEEKLAAYLSAYEEVMSRSYVMGRDLLEAGAEESPLVGDVLRHAHKLRLAGVDKDEALRHCLGYYRKAKGDVEAEGAGARDDS